MQDSDLIITGATRANEVTFSHDDTDLNIVGTNTTDINITGITAVAAGTVDADFDAITATSYGGITEANLLDKTATETITGNWLFDSNPKVANNKVWRGVETGGTARPLAGINSSDVVVLGTSALPMTINATAVTIAATLVATSYGGITEANLVDKSATETISGEWTHSGRLITDDSTTSRAGFNIPEGVDPTSPVDGDIWVTTTDIFARINGVSESLKGGAGTTNDVVQARRTTNYTLTTSFADVTLDTTDVESDASEVEHNNTNTDDVDVKTAGTYEIGYEIDAESTGTNDTITIDGRVRLNDSSVIAGSEANAGVVTDAQITGSDIHNHLSNTFFVSLAANDTVTLQLQKTEIGSSGTFNATRVLFKVKRLL